MTLSAVRGAYSDRREPRQRQRPGQEERRLGVGGDVRGQPLES